MQPYNIKVKKYFIWVNFVFSFCMSIIGSIILLLERNNMEFEKYELFKNILIFLCLFFIPAFINALIVMIFQLKYILKNKIILFLISFFTPAVLMWISMCSFKNVDNCFTGISIAYMILLVPLITNSALQVYLLKKVSGN